MSWKLDNIDFKDYGVIVSKSSGVLDLPTIEDFSTDWLDANGKDYWQSASNTKYNDNEIVLQCWIFADGYDDFKAKVGWFFSVLLAENLRTLSTPFGNDIDISLQSKVQVFRKSQYNQSIQAGQFTLSLTVTGDSKTKLFTVYNSDASVVTYVKYGTDCKITRSLQGVSEISFTTEFNSIKTLGRGDYMMYHNEKYVSLEYPQIDKFSSNKFVYHLTFVNQFFLLKDIQFRSEGESDFYWWANVQNIVDKVVENVNNAYPDLFGSGNVESTEYRNNQFQNENCYDVISRIASDYLLEFDFRWNVSDSTIRIDVKLQIGSTFGNTYEYGKGEGLHKINRVSTGRDLLVTRLYAYGSTKNIPTGYGYPRLKLATEPVLGDFYGMYIEKTKIWEDIFPHRTGTVTGYTYVDPVSSDLPETAEYRLYDSSMFDLNAVSGGSTIYLNGATAAKVHFNSGDMAGFEFEVKKFKYGFDDSDASASGGTFYLIPVKEVPDTMYPNTDTHPGAGNEYVLLDINLPQSPYIDDAEAELQAVADAWVDEYKNPKPTYTIETDPYFAFAAYRPGDRFTIIDADFGIPDGELVRITDITTNLYQGGSTIALADFVVKSRIKKLTEKINSIERSIVNANLDPPNIILHGKYRYEDPSTLKNAIINPLDDKINPDAVRKKIIQVVSTDTPEITDYNLKYGETIGQYPTVRLFEIDGDGNRIERTEKPYMLINSDTGLIDSITFGTLPDVMTGHIILQ